MKSYYFVFCKDSLLLEQQADGTCTVPCREEPPTEVKPWTTVLNVAPMDDGTEVKTYAIDTIPTAPSPLNPQPSTPSPSSPCARPTTSCHCPST